MNDLILRAELAIAEARALTAERRRIMAGVESTRAAVEATVAELRSRDERRLGQPKLISVS